jgi:hypothetical protein
MPDFRLQLTGIPGLTSVVWTDPATASRPSRIQGVNDQQFRRLVAVSGTQLLVEAIRDGQSAVEPDSVVGLFTMWPIEWPTSSPVPSPEIVTPGTSAAQAFSLVDGGHYTFAVRHEDTNAGVGSNAGGAIVFHLDVQPPT